MSLTGILAVLLLLVMLILLLQTTWFDRIGIGKASIFRIHHILAWIFIVLASAHIILACAPQNALWKSASFTKVAITFLNDTLTISGFFAYFIFFLVTVTAGFDWLQRRFWILLHRTSLFALAALGFHLVYAWSHLPADFDLITLIRGSLLFGVILVSTMVVWRVMQPRASSAQKRQNKT